MAKKSRRARPQSAPVSGTGAQPVRISRSVRPPTAEAQAKKVNFASEYHYVIEDLKRIAIYAAGLFALLIVLAIVLT
jgi:hypothetical protein